MNGLECIIVLSRIMSGDGPYADTIIHVLGVLVDLGAAGYTTCDSAVEGTFKKKEQHDTSVLRTKKGDWMIKFQSNLLDINKEKEQKETTCTLVLPPKNASNADCAPSCSTHSK